MSTRVIVAGGGGYIGSHTALALRERGFTPIVIDNFTMGNRDLAAALGVEICEGDLGDPRFLREVFERTKPQAVMHFAAFAYVGESVQNPSKYYVNNISTTITLLDTMRAAGIDSFIFSSTCATYGTPATLPITEETSQAPINPYGYTKLVVERLLSDYAHAYGLRSVIFRYFNASGAHPSGLIGERHDPETHLIPLAIAGAMGGRALSVFGDDYDTPDGTCIRDYIHVDDIADAHIRGLESLLRDRHSAIYNIGTGVGNSVMEVIRSIERISGKKVPFEMKPRRAGDPPRLVASATKLEAALGWKPRYVELDEIIKTAWEWHVKDAARR